MMNEWKEITGNDVTFESDICTSTVTFWLGSDRATNRESNYVSNYVTENTQKILDYCLTQKREEKFLLF